MKLQRKIKLELFFRSFAGYVAIFAAFGFYSWFVDKLLEAALVFVCYLSMRLMFPKTFHTKPMLCIFLSITSFSFAISNTAPVTISLLSIVGVAFTIDFILWKVQDYLDLKNAFTEEEQLRRKCRELGFSKSKEEFAVSWLIGKKSIKEQMEEHGLGEQTVKNYRGQIKRALKGR